MGIDFWGPRVWRLMHLASYYYSDHPNQEQLQIFKFFYTVIIPNIIPCPKCQRHYLKNLQELPVRLKNRHKLIRWVVDIHNRVNTLKSKPLISYETSDKFYRDKNFEDDIKSLNKYFRKRMVNRRLSPAMYNNYVIFVRQIYPQLF